MFVSKKQNFVYLRTPKSGSTSMSHYLIEKLGADSDSIYTMINLLNIGSKNLPERFYGFNPHSSVEQIVKAGIVDKKFVEQTNIYACLREPVDRFISRSYHIKNFDRNRSVQGLSKNQLVEKCLTMYDPTFHMWWPQTTWCMLDGKPVNKLFLHEDFDKAASEMTGVDTSVNYRHRSNCREDDPTPLDSNLIQEIKKLYSDDVALYKSIKG
jgi:hypothetical protein